MKWPGARQVRTQVACGPGVRTLQEDLSSQANSFKLEDVDKVNCLCGSCEGQTSSKQEDLEHYESKKLSMRGSQAHCDMGGGKAGPSPRMGPTKSLKVRGSQHVKGDPAIVCAGASRCSRRRQRLLKGQLLVGKEVPDRWPPKVHVFICCCCFSMVLLWFAGDAAILPC